MNTKNKFRGSKTKEKDPYLHWKLLEDKWLKVWLGWRTLLFFGVMLALFHVWSVVDDVAWAGEEDQPTHVADRLAMSEIKGGSQFCTMRVGCHWRRKQEEDEGDDGKVAKCK